MANGKAAPLRVVFFGDSICVGQGVSVHRGWVSRLSACLEERFGGHAREVVVVNASVNGQTTRQALERMAYDVQSGGVDIMLVQFGLNDCNHWQSDRGLPRVSPAAFAANLVEILERGRRFGARMVMLNTNHPTTRDGDVMAHTEITYEDSNARYSQIIRDVAGRSGDFVLLNDMARRFGEVLDAGEARLTDLLLADGLHLSRQGHDIYYDAIAPRLLPVIEDLLR